MSFIWVRTTDLMTRFKDERQRRKPSPKISLRSCVFGPSTAEFVKSRWVTCLQMPGCFCASIWWPKGEAAQIQELPARWPSCEVKNSSPRQLNCRPPLEFFVLLS